MIERPPQTFNTESSDASSSRRLAVTYTYMRETPDQSTSP